MSMTSTAPLHAGLFYGSTNGDTQNVAARLASLCESPADQWLRVTLHDVASTPLHAMLEYSYLLIGAPTWNVGQLQRDWEAVFEDFDALDLQGTHVAIFGLGDQVGYPDTFVDALAYFADKLGERGASLYGRWPAVGYSFDQSWALGDDGCFVGLVLDELNQPQKTEARLILWLAQLRREWRSSL